MKRPLILLLVVVAGALAHAGAPLPTLHGVSEDGAVTWVLLQGGDETVSRWVRVGARFEDYQVEAWQREAQVVVLRLEGRQTLVPLDSAKTQATDADAGGSRPAAWRAELRQLAASACQYFLEQGGERVTAAELIGAEKPLFRLEALTGESCANLAFVVGPRGVETITGDKAAALLAADEELRIQAGPTLSLARIAERLRVPLAKLRELNPELNDAPFSEAKTVRLQ